MGPFRLLTNRERMPIIQFPIAVEWWPMLPGNSLKAGSGTGVENGDEGWPSAVAPNLCLAILAHPWVGLETMPRAFESRPVPRKRTEFTFCQLTIVYGPVESRRLGPSIGINLYPGRFKVCTLNCRYCFIPPEAVPLAQEDMPGPDKVIAELNSYFAAPEKQRKVARSRFITFSGNGEPTCHAKFAEIAEQVSQWRRDHASQLGLAIFTNGTTLDRPDVRKALLVFDKVFIKLDWGSQEELDYLSRPHVKVDFPEFVKRLSEFSATAKAARPNPPVVALQTAIYPDLRGEESWRRWAEHVVEISPDEVQLYQLDFAGRDFQPPEHFDFLQFQRMICALLKQHPVAVKFFYSSPFYVNVDLCYAVDSVIYLPLYVADSQKLFQKQGVVVNHYVSNDGDRGAVNAIRSGRAQFAICDPQAAFDVLCGGEPPADRDNGPVSEGGAPADRDNDPVPEGGASADGDNDPVLVAVLIDRLALWALSHVHEAAGSRDVLMQCDKVVTYAPGSTAHYVCTWQRDNLPENKRPSLQPVQPGDELRATCAELSGPASCNCAVITADVFGCVYCRQGCGNEAMSLLSYARSKPRRRFLFTGLLASRDVIRRCPGAVDAVVDGLRDAIESLNDSEFMEKSRNDLLLYLKDVYEKKQPWYLLHCASSRVGLPAALGLAIDELTRCRIYSRDGRLSFRSVFNALRVRQRERPSGAGPSYLEIMRWVDSRAAGFLRRAIVASAGRLARLANMKPLRLLVGSLFLAAGTTVASVAAVKSVGVSQGLLYALAGVLGSLSATAILSLAWSALDSRRGTL